MIRGSAMGALSTALPFVTLILMVAAMARPQHVRTRETIDASGKTTLGNPGQRLVVQRNARQGVACVLATFAQR